VFETTIRDRFAVIARHVAPGVAVLDLGCVDARPARRTGQTSAGAANLLFRRIMEMNPDTLGVDVDAEGVAALGSVHARSTRDQHRRRINRPSPGVA
jgi:hypothetical protein